MKIKNKKVICKYCGSDKLIEGIGEVCILDETNKLSRVFICGDCGKETIIKTNI